MVDAGLPLAFVLRVLELAKESEGVRDLVHLWAEAPDENERNEVEAELQGSIDDREDPGPTTRVESVEQADRLLDQRRREKEHLRRLVEAHGGVSEVARQAEMPQPSLSRLLNAMSETRPSTLLKLARAMDLPLSALELPTRALLEPAGVRPGDVTAGETPDRGSNENSLWISFVRELGVVPIEAWEFFAVRSGGPNRRSELHELLLRPSTSAGPWYLFEDAIARVASTYPNIRFETWKQIDVFKGSANLLEFVVAEPLGDREPLKRALSAVHQRLTERLGAQVHSEV